MQPTPGRSCPISYRYSPGAFTGDKALVFNGDFHWFDVAPEDFAFIDETVLGCHAIRGNVIVEAIPLRYDAVAWERRFVAQWPPGSDAHRSYFERIVNGPDYELRNAA